MQIQASLANVFRVVPWGLYTWCVIKPPFMIFKDPHIKFNLRTTAKDYDEQFRSLGSTFSRIVNPFFTYSTGLISFVCFPYATFFISVLLRT